MFGTSRHQKRYALSTGRAGLAAVLAVSMGFGLVGASGGPGAPAAAAERVGTAEAAAPAVVTAAAADTTTISWLQKASAAIARAEAGGVAAGGKLYVFGGQYTGVTQTLRSDRYDPVTDTWTRLRDLPELITHAPVVADGTTLWILGGYVGLNDKDSSRRVWKYDIPTDTYTAGPALPAARGAGGAAIVGRQLHYLTGAVRQDSTGGPTVEVQHPVVGVVDGRAPGGVLPSTTPTTGC